ncbi:MAG: hypothetical protein R2879_02490 [Saprospiraceae bacterium]
MRIHGLIKFFVFLSFALGFLACEPDPPGEGRYVKEDFEGQEQVLLRLICESAPDNDPDKNPNNFVYFYFGDSKVKLGQIKECRTIPYDSWAKFGIPEASIAVTGGWWEGVGNYYYIVRDDGKLKVYLKTIKDSDEVPGPAKEVYVAKEPEELQ